jgi:hypothetical protein
MSFRKSLLFVSVVLATAGFTRNLHAENTVEPQPSVASPQGQADSTSTLATPGIVEEPSESRFRWGISAAGGPLLGAYSGGAGGIDARFGMQMSPLLGLYAQPILMAGAGVSGSAKGASATGLGLYGLGAMVDTTLANLFYVAGGPELLFGAVGTAAANANGSTSASASTGPFFSLAARTGFAFGSMRPDRRKAFTLGLDLHVVFAGGAAVLPMLGLGYEAF